MLVPRGITTCVTNANCIDILARGGRVPCQDYVMQKPILHAGTATRMMHDAYTRAH